MLTQGYDGITIHRDALIYLSDSKWIAADDAIAITQKHNSIAKPLNATQFTAFDASTNKQKTVHHTTSLGQAVRSAISQLIFII